MKQIKSKLYVFKALMIISIFIIVLFSIKYHVSFFISIITCILFNLFLVALYIGRSYYFIYNENKLIVKNFLKPGFIKIYFYEDIENIEIKKMAASGLNLKLSLHNKRRVFYSVINLKEADLGAILRSYQIFCEKN